MSKCILLILCNLVSFFDFLGGASDFLLSRWESMVLERALLGELSLWLVEYIWKVRLMRLGRSTSLGRFKWMSHWGFLNTWQKYRIVVLSLSRIRPSFCLQILILFWLLWDFQSFVCLGCEEVFFIYFYEWNCVINVVKLDLNWVWSWDFCYWG